MIHTTCAVLGNGSGESRCEHASQPWIPSCHHARRQSPVSCRLSTVTVLLSGPTLASVKEGATKLEGAGEAYARSSGWYCIRWQPRPSVARGCETNKAFLQPSLHGRHIMPFAYLIGHARLHDAVQQSHCAPVTANGDLLTYLRLVCRDHGEDNLDRLLAHVHVCRRECPGLAICGTARRYIPCLTFAVLTHGPLAHVCIANAYDQHRC